MNETTDWSNVAAITLVKEYEKREELWRKEHNMYRVPTAKHAAWKALAQMFSCDTPTVKKKFNSLLASHRRERLKVKERGKSSWFLYPHLKFIRDYLTANKEDQEETSTEHYEQIETLEQLNTQDISNIDSDETHVRDEDEEMVFMVKDEPEQIQAFTFKNFKSTGNHRKPRLTSTLKRRQRRPIVQSHLQSNLQANQATEQEAYSQAYVDSRILKLQRMMQRESLQRKDDCDAYGEYIASMLRKRDKKTRCLIKQAINNVLFEQEMNEYENPLAPDMDVEVLEQSDELDP